MGINLYYSSIYLYYNYTDLYYTYIDLYYSYTDKLKIGIHIVCIFVL